MIGHQAAGDQIRDGQDLPLETEQTIQVIPNLEKICPHRSLPG